MTTPELVSLAKSIAANHKLDPALVCAVCEHESGGWNVWAIRYENGFYDRYISGQLTHLSSTEARARAFSYGLMQIMGQTARELGFTGTYLSELLDPAIAIEYGCRKLAQCLALAYGNVTDSLMRYNGGSDALYPGMVMPLMKKYQ